MTGLVRREREDKGHRARPPATAQRPSRKTRRRTEGIASAFLANAFRARPGSVGTVLFTSAFLPPGDAIAPRRSPPRILPRTPKTNTPTGRACCAAGDAQSLSWGKEGTREQHSSLVVILIG